MHTRNAIAAAPSTTQDLAHLDAPWKRHSLPSMTTSANVVPPAKRSRGHAPTQPGGSDWTPCPTIPNFAWISCFDESDRMIEVDTRLLSPFGRPCRLYKHIEHVPPFIDPNTKRTFWKTNMTRAMLQTFVRSLEHGELSVGKNVSITEALTTFEYEGIFIGVPAERKGDAELLYAPPPGVSFPKRVETVAQIVTRTSEQIAQAIARWPRLEACLDGALNGMPLNCTCTSTRAWVRFCSKPMLQSNDTLSLARRWPRWLEYSLMMFGVLHVRMARAGVITLSARDEETFSALLAQIEGDVLSWLLMTPLDHPRQAMDKVTRKEQHAGEKFANELRQVVLESASRDMTMNTVVAPPPPDPDPPSDFRFSRACFSLAEHLIQTAPSPATMYSGTCCDDSGRSAERQQLAKALKMRGITVVRWSDDDKTPPPRPLVFPPSWAHTALSGSSQACMLLDFSDKR